MGIPRLTTTLGAYAVQERLQNNDVVIDGPAVAYHILHMFRGNGISWPSYELLGEGAIAWLNELQRQQVKMSIYFDGYLPDQKRATRMERMMKGTARLAVFFSANRNGYPCSHQASRIQLDWDLFAHHKHQSQMLLYPSFLVPAVIDAIRGYHDYESRCFIIPGEADIYCARDIALHGGILLTSDSDLLVHEISGGKVAFLRDIYRDASSGITCATIAPQNVYLRLGLQKSMAPCRFGYELQKSPNASVAKLVRACSQPPMNQDDYEIFRRQYIGQGAVSLPKTIQGDFLSLSKLDPRLSEFLLQLGQYQSGSSQTGFRAQMFLPLLIENPFKRSAWDSSGRIRRLAYSIAGWFLQTDYGLTVQEYRRVQTPNQLGREVKMMPSDAIISTISELLVLITRIQNRMADDNDFWILICVVEDILESRKQDKPSHGLQMLQRWKEFCTMPTDKLSWDLIHLVASVEAGLYSYRILDQILSICPQQDVDAVAATLKHMRARLPKLLPLSKYPDASLVVNFLSRVDKLQINQLLAEFVDILDMFEKPPQRPHPGARQDNGIDNQDLEDFGDTEAILTCHPQSGGGNRFSVLSVDN